MEYLGEMEDLGKWRTRGNGGPGEMEDLGKWKTWGNEGPGERRIWGNGGPREAEDIRNMEVQVFYNSRGEGLCNVYSTLGTLES